MRRRELLIYLKNGTVYSLRVWQTKSVEHKIKLSTDETIQGPISEDTSLVEVREHLCEMLDAGVKCKTAFQAGTLGFFEFNRMPFGLCNAPATFQRLMDGCMGDMNLRHCLIYLDDIVVFSSTFVEHIERL